jgi:sortase A
LDLPDPPPHRDAAATSQNHFLKNYSQVNLEANDIVKDNYQTQFPKSPEVHPLRSIQAKVWQIVGLILISGGLIVMGWGGWMFYQQQAELYNPPAPIVDAAALADLDTPTAQAPPAEPPPTIKKVTDETLAVDPDPTAPPEPTQTMSLTQSLPLEDEIDPKPPNLPPAEAVTEGEEVALVEAKFSEETVLSSDPDSEDVPSLADNPLVVVEDVPASTEAGVTAGDSTAAATSPPTRIVAESINLDASVVETGWTQVVRDGVATNVWIVADYAAGWHKNSMLPGQGGNIVFSGHHNIKGEVFRYIVDLAVGDTVSIYVDDQRYDYAISDKFIVKDKGEPESVRRANAKWIGPFNEERLTLVTCWPYNNNTHRVIVIAKPV